MLGSTDAGRAKWIESLSKDMEVECAIITKRRTSGTETSISGVNCDVKNKTVIIYDDMIRTGGSIMKAAKVYREAGATKVFVIATHGILPGDTTSKLNTNRDIEAIYLTNTHPKTQEEILGMDFFKVKSIAPLIVKEVFSK